MMQTRPKSPPSKTQPTRRALLHRLCAGLLSAFVIAAQPSPGRADQAADAAGFLISLTDRAIAELADASIPVDERKMRFRKLFKESFDIPAIGRFVLGRYWRSASDEAQREFLTVFEDVMVERFGPQFEGYAGTKFQIGVIREVQEDNQLMVSSTIAPPNAEVAQVDWRLRNDGGRFMVLDVVAQGVSMALTLRSEYATVLKNSGGKIDALIALLRQRTTKTG
ncbi:MAG TPA: ABC transporter substrate-binding protein [Kiloniellales bacterium]